MESNKLQELKKKFIIDQGKYEKEKLESHLEKTLKYGRATSEGRVVLKKGPKSKQKIGLVLVIRYLANKIDEKISENVTIEEIISYTGVERKQVRARCSDLVNDGIISRLEGGLFRFNASLIDEFIDKLDNK